MKLNMQLALGAVALVAIAYHLGKRRANAAAGVGTATAHNIADTADQFWTYAGSWN